MEMHGYNFTFGFDPEGFVYDKVHNQYVSPKGIISGTKNKPVPLGKEGFFMQVDGLAAEFNTPIRDNFKDAQADVYTGIKLVQDVLDKHENGRYEYHMKDYVLFKKAVIDSVDDDSLRLGCDPDFNAFTMRANPAPIIPDNIRTGSCHLHVGWGKGIDINDPHLFEACAILASRLTFGDTVRGFFYGSDGSFRPKPYGVELRTLSFSNMRLFGERTVSNMIGAAFNHGKNWAPLRQRLDGVFNYDRPDDQRQRRLFTRHRGNIRLAANANIALRAGRKPDALPTGIRLMDSVNDAIAAQTGDR